MIQEKEIGFIFIDGIDNCCEDEFHGCCCHCKSHLKIFAHCLHVKHEKEGCNCHDEMGFFVCSLFSEVDNTDVGQISGLHGICECFNRRKDATN